ncbi:universal stress protein [Halorhabdus sp. CBA1104]|uniref:universal stress protein n=1 Tax=unclassified Halorhabdus TaxID=2621901 RepID=UPI0012B1CDF3|nr:MULTISPECIES: universal stress protein [unclassified Halorhabdus]QGN07638.1 universal stress protein [Halorhabdus sp. CBA1104]
MARHLVVVMDGNEREIELLETATAFSDCRGAELLVLRTASPADYDQMAETMETIGEVEQRSYSDDELREGLKSDARKAAEEATDGTDVTAEVRLAIVDDDERAETILSTARDNDCEHVFLVGQRRSPTGKALFGDVTQEVILNFDGEITLSME